MVNDRDGEIILGIDIPASIKIMEEDAKEALSQIKDLKVKVENVELSDKAESELQAQLNKLKNTSVKVSDVKVDQAQLNKGGQQLGKSLGDSIDKGMSSSLNSVRQNIENVIKSFNGQRLNSANLMKMFNIDASKVDSSVIQQIRGLTNEINVLSKEAVKSGSGSGIDKVIEDITSLSQVLKQFGFGRDLEQFRESLDVLDYFKGKKIHVDEVSELLANTGMGVRGLNNEFRNLDVTFTTLEKDTVKLDTVWEELFQISPSLNQFDNFGEQINAVIEHLRTAKEALYGDSNLVPINANDVSDVLLKFVDNMDEAIAKVTLLREQESEIWQSMSHNDTSDSIEESVKELEKESSAMKDVEESADKAAQEKIEFADANRRVADSAENTSRAVEQEHHAIQSLDDLGYILHNVNMQGQEGTGVFQQFGNTLKEAFYAFTAANLLQDAIYKVIDGGKEAVETVKELNDAAMALRMATGDSYESVKQMMKEYNAMGQELGAVTTSVSDAADAWLRQGHSIADTNMLIKDSMMLSKVAELNATDSTEFLTSAMKGYQLTAQEVEQIVNKLTAVDLVSATDAGGLAEGMSRVASTSNSAGIEMDKLLGYLAATGEVTQETMSVIGNSFKTIFTRMADIKSGKLELIDEDGTKETLSDVETVLNGVGIQLRKTDNEFRNFGDVLDDLSSKWDTYSTVQQAAIAKAFSGTRQQERFRVLMENYDRAIEYSNVSLNSEGSANEKFGYYLESLEAKTNSLKASLENLASTTISDELYGSVLDTTKAMVDMTAQSGILKGVLAGIGTSGAIYAFQQLVGYLHNAAQEFSDFGTALQMTRSGQVGISDMQNLINLTGGLTQSQTRLLLSTNNLTDAQKIAVLMNQRLAQGLPQITEVEAMQQLQTMGVASAEGVATGATITFTSALRGLWSTLIANPLVLVAAAVSAGVMAWNKHKQAVDDARQSMLSAGEAAKDEAKNIIELYNAYAQADSAYKSNMGSKEQLEGATESLLDVLGVEQSEIKNLIEKYGSLDEAIQNVTNDTLKNKLSDLTNGYQAAKEELKDLSESEAVKEFFNPFHKGKNTVDAYITRDLDAFNILRTARLDSNVKEGKFQFDVSSAEDAVSMYEKLIQMKETLEAETGNGKLYTSIDELGRESELYGAIISKINEMSDSYSTVIDYISDIDKTAAQLEYNLYKANNGIPETVEEFEQLKETLMKTAESSGRFVGSQKQIEDSIVNALANIPELTKYIDEYNQSLGILQGNISDSAQSTIPTINTTQFLSSMQQLSEGFDQMDKIYADVKDQKEFDWSSILNNDDFTKAFGDMTNVTEEYKNAYDEFIDTVSKSPDDISACQSAFDNLATAYLYNSDKLKDVSEATKQATVNMLEEMGVVNALEVVEYQLAQNDNLAKAKEEQSQACEVLKQSIQSESDAKEVDRLAAIDLANAEQSEIQALFEAAKSADTSTNALLQLELAKIATNGVAIDTSADIQNLINLATQAELTASTLLKIKNLSANYSSYQKAYDQGNWGEVYKYRQGLNEAKQEVSSDVSNEVAAKVGVQPKVNYGGGATSNKSSGGGGGGGGKSKSKKEQALEDFNKYVSKLFDWIEVRLSRVQRKIDNAIKRAEFYLENDLYKKSFKQYEKAIKETTKLIKNNQKGSVSYEKQANTVINKAVKEGLISKSQRKDIKKKVADGSIDIKKYNDATQAVINSYKQFYDKSVSCSDAVVDLSQKLQDYYESLYNIPLEKASDKIEKFNDSISVLSATLENISVNNYKDANKNLDKQLDLQNKINSANQDALKETNDNLKSASKSLTKNSNLNKKSGINSKEKKSIKKAVKNGEEVNLTMFKEGTSGYKAAEKYNEALKKHSEAAQAAALSEQELQKQIRETAKSQFD